MLLRNDKKLSVPTHLNLDTRSVKQKFIGETLFVVV